MISPFAQRAAVIFGAATLLWVLPASAAELPVPSSAASAACRSDSAMRSITAGKKALMAGRPLLSQPAAETNYSPVALRDRPDSEKKSSDVWFRRQFVLLVGVGF